MGTIGYMAPEQLRGEPVEATADVWALGAVLYEMATGRVAFPGDNEGAVVYAILQSDPPLPSMTVAGVPTAFDRLIEKSLAKRVADRPADAAQVCRELAALRSTVEAMDEQPTLLHRETDLQVSSPERPLTQPSLSGHSVAVIDFNNIAGDAESDWLSGGIAETLSVDLKKISSLRVVGRRKTQEVLASVDVTRLDDDELVDLGNRLGARWLLWGGFQRVGEAIRLTAQCFDVSAASTLETVKVDGSMGEIFALQDRILKTMLDALDLQISDSEVQEIERPETEDLEAYEYCAKARELTYIMRPEDFPVAADYLRQAIELDPGYALAYSSLGQLHCLRFIGTTDPDDLAIAVHNLQRAVELDPELGDPHAWLTYAYSRERRYDEAVASGRRAVQVEPDNPSSHYFLAVAIWLQGMDEYRTESYQEAIDHLRRVNVLAPRYQPGYQIQASVHFHSGRYREAFELLQTAAEIEEQGTFELGKFVGAIGLQGRIAFRLGRVDEAEELLDRAFQVSGEAVHVYTPVCNALTHCWRGDLLLSRHQREEGLRAYRAAREQVVASPRSLGIGWALLRSHVGQATCLHLLGMRRESTARYQEALALLESKADFDFSGVWDSGDAQILFELASYLARVHQTEEALDMLERAGRCGWLEYPRLDQDLALETIRDSPRFRRLQGDLAARLGLD